VKRHLIGPGSLSIARLLGLAIGGLVLLAVLTVLALQLYSSRANLLELIKRDFERAFYSIDLALAGHLVPATEQLRFLADHIDSGRLDPADRGRLADFMTGALAATPQITGLLFIGEDRRMLEVKHEAGQLTEIREVPSKSPERLEALLAEMAAAEAARWEELVHFGGETYINLRQPVRRDGRFLGFLVALVGMNELSQIVTDIGEAHGSNPFILYGDEHVLAHPNLMSPHPDLSVQTPVARIGRVGDPILAAISEGHLMPAFKSLEADSIEVLGVEVNDAHYVVAYKRIDGYGEVPWRIGGWVPMESAFGAMSRLHNAALAGLAVAVLAVVLAVILGRTLARPIRRAASGSAQIAALDLERVEELPASRIAELNEQAGAFNTTLGALRSFERYVPRRLVARLIHDSADGAAQSQERELTVLFTDIVGFTAMSERLPAREVADFLNEHFTLLAHFVEAEEGTIDKYIGDSLMAFWGAPDVQEDHAARACRAARAIAEAMEADNAARAAAGLAPVRIRVGIHSGPVLVGNIGAPGRINYTIVGDTVNISQRLEGLARDFDRGAAATVLIGEATARAVEGEIPLEFVGSCAVKGREEEVRAYRPSPG
jgi:class 3 adenylate cyclase